jgi:iron complex transport system ATP-binding protein
VSLQLCQLRAERGSFSLAVDQWALQPGNVGAVLGCNGAGKSTLFSLLSSEAQYAGEVRLHGRELRSWPSSARARHIGVLPQSSQLAFAFTAEEVVALGLTPLSLGWRAGRAAVHRALAQVDCLALADRAFPTLSGGERQRVQLARVLLQLSEAEAPPLLLLDEPTSAQDLGQQHTVLSLLRDLARHEDYLVVAILHDLNQVLRYSDECLLLRQGAAVATGRPEGVLTPATVERCWGYRPRRLGEPGCVPALL